MDFLCPQLVDFEALMNEEVKDISTDSLCVPTRPVTPTSMDEQVSGMLSDNEEEYPEGNSREVDNSPQILQSGDVSSSSQDFEVHLVRTKVSLQSKHVAENTASKPMKFGTERRLRARKEVPKRKSDRIRGKKFEGEASQTHETVNYVPLAEQVKKFQEKTPQRFHSTAQKEFQPQEHWSPKRVTAKTPILRAVRRHRAVSALSQEEREEKELAEIKSHPFQANLLDPKIYGASSGFSRKKSPEKTYEFRARPVPEKILKGTVGLGKKRTIPLTAPKSPTFSVDDRIKRRKVLQQEESQLNVSKRQKLKPKRTPKPPMPELPEFKLTHTVVQPFSFDKSDHERFSNKEKRIQEEIEKENKLFVFKAQPLPPDTPSSLPVVDRKPPTVPVPFNLTETNKHEPTVEETRYSFRANPATVLAKEPFIPEKPQHSIEIMEFNLRTNRRASVRRVLQERKQQEEQELEQLRAQEKLKQEEEERKSILQMRKELVHKAQPINNFKPVSVKPSDKPLTEPVSPRFATVKRLRARK